ncbi:predicted protein [Botrytis cinerea T4]|uniref:Uncharacterized protein n=1 Tax=Botryotinia fuckeliana (strain T4) TaxID=999810 RepID=G2XP17_BOTF4|nr:predicted protein [Botrytis cinerea T4]
MAENFDKTKTQNSETSNDPIMMDDIKTLEGTEQMNNSVMMDRSKLGLDEKEVDEGRLAGDVEMADESNSLSDDKAENEN